jgi:hypothetical protein
MMLGLSGVRMDGTVDIRASGRDGSIVQTADMGTENLI